METLDTLTSISDSDATLISDEAQVIDKLNLVIREVHDQIGITENLSDVLTSGLDFLQSIYNNKLQDKNNLLSEKNNTLQGYNN
ncbi:MAG: hypothetical protein QG670_576 [Thermoproteota archaeon]|nr:hypothetical protein [Thermoproteota archaeon]